MKIIISNEIGFCFGVKQALKVVKEKISRAKKPIRMYGYLIHNEEVVQDLQSMGIKITNNVSNIKNGTLIITAHGISPELKKNIEQRENLTVLDTTCPKVSAVHKIAEKLSKEGRIVLVFGDLRHQEVIGIKGAAGEKARVFSTIKDFYNFNLDKNKKYGLVVQTTQDTKKFEEVEKIAKKTLSDIKIVNTICYTTYKRQNEIREIAKKTDIVLIIGSKTSANTRRLFKISSVLNPRTFFITGPDDLRKQWLIGIESAGIGAGASTPDSTIKKVVEKVKQLTEKK